MPRAICVVAQFWGNVFSEDSQGGVIGLDRLCEQEGTDFAIGICSLVVQHVT